MAEAVNAVFGNAAEADGDDGSLLQYDVGNLYVFDPTPIDPKVRQLAGSSQPILSRSLPFSHNYSLTVFAQKLKGEKRREKFLHQQATAVVGKLFKKFLALEKTATDVGTTIVLPTPTMRLPREKPLPAPKKQTKWEKFAQSKDIQNRKRERMVWDDESQQWRPRWGYKRDAELKDWLVELKPGENDLSHFEKAKLKKQQRILKNKKQQLHNANLQAQEHGEAMRLPEGIPAALGSSLPKAGSKQRRGMNTVTKQLERAQRSTASMGKFDDYQPREAPRKLQPKRRKFKEMHATTQKRDLKIMNQMFGDSGVGAAPEPEHKKARNNRPSKKALAALTSMGAKRQGAKGASGKGRGRANKGKGKGKTKR